MTEGHGSGQEVEDYTEPILPGTAPSDYERYLRTDELLALQKAPDEMAHRDELLFQTVHQSSELWLKLAVSRSRLRSGCCARASFRRLCACSAAPRTA